MATIQLTINTATGRNLKNKKDNAGYGIGVPHFCTIESIIKII